MLRGSSFSIVTSTTAAPRKRAWINGTATTSTTMPTMSNSFLFIGRLSSEHGSEEHDDEDRREHDERGVHDRFLRERLVAHDREHEPPDRRGVERQQHALERRRA